MHRKKEVVPPPAASGTLGAALERSERRKQSAAESRELKRSSSSGGDKRDHKLSVSADTPRDKNSFLQRSRSNSGDHTIKRSGSGNGDNNNTTSVLLLSSSPVAVARQYKTSSSPGLSPNITRQNKIFLSSAKIRPPKFNKDGA